MLVPEEIQLLPKFGSRLTDIAKIASGPDAQLSENAWELDMFRRQVERLRPRIVVFNGNSTAEEFQHRGGVCFGRQSDRIGQTMLLALPSGTASSYWDPRARFHLPRFVRGLHRSHRAIKTNSDSLNW